MDILITLAVFTAAMMVCIAAGLPLYCGLLAGYAAFLAVGLRRGCRMRRLLSLSLHGIRDVLPVLYIMLIIGVLTATWRMSGTILYFVYYGVRLITPRLFIVTAFLLTSLVAYALGTSFGVSATVGVILMAIARSGGVAPALAAGAIFSGVYFGDRGSPVSSAANVVAALTHTDIYGNVRWMHRTAVLPFALTTLLYAVLSWFNPIHSIDPAMLTAIRQDFTITHLLAVPLLLMLVLPMCKAPIWLTCACSIGAAGLLSVFVQGIAPEVFFKACLFGYQPAAGALGSLLQGGGAFSMVEVIVIVLISSTYSGLFEETGMLRDIAALFDRSVSRVGRFATALWLSAASVAVFCNQTIASIICITLLREPYHRTGAGDRELAIDMENSVIVIAGLVPWCIACSAPLAFMDAGPAALPWAFYLWLVPLCHWAVKKHFDFTK